MDSKSKGVQKMKLDEFVENNEVDYSYNRVNETFLSEIEKKVGVRIGEQLKRYIMNYGYLGYKYIELLGINSSQGFESDMIKQTLLLHKRFDTTKNLIALEDQGDGDYYLVDETDMVYRFIPDNNISKTGIDLDDYILNRFMTV